MQNFHLRLSHLHTISILNHTSTIQPSTLPSPKQNEPTTTQSKAKNQKNNGRRPRNHPPKPHHPTNHNPPSLPNLLPLPLHPPPFNPNNPPPQKTKLHPLNRQRQRPPRSPPNPHHPHPPNRRRRSKPHREPLHRRTRHARCLGHLGSPIFARPRREGVDVCLSAGAEVGGAVY